MPYREADPMAESSETSSAPTSAAEERRAETCAPAEGRLRWVAVLTSLAAAAPFLLHIAEQPQRMGEPRTLLWLAAFTAFVGLFWAPPAKHPDLARRRRHGLFLVSLHALLALALFYLEPLPLFAVFLVIVAAGWGETLPAAAAVTCVVVQTLLVAPALVGPQGWRDGIILLVVFLGFQLFAVYTVHVAEAERRARRELAAANLELRRTRARLAESSKAEERLRISRDLHDVLGHHLTALSLNLEAARHAEGDAVGDHVATAHAVTRRLLGEVRRVVGHLRREDGPEDGAAGATEDEAVNGASAPASASRLAAALAALGEGIERPRLHVAVAPSVDDLEGAAGATLLSCAREVVTNAARHADADHLWLEVERRDGGVALTGRDDGEGGHGVDPDDLTRLGHGLRGMRERLEHLGGRLEVAPRPGHGFEVTAWLPTA